MESAGAGMAEEGNIERVEDSKDLQQQSKALDKLTDHVEDRQLDSTRVQEAMASISASKEADLNAMKLRCFQFTFGMRQTPSLLRSFRKTSSFSGFVMISAI
nr:PREDICTED: uncharacterized protein LOC108199278 isoform X2 [Daucus carota subsp. sativus]